MEDKNIIQPEWWNGRRDGLKIHWRSLSVRVQLPPPALFHLNIPILAEGVGFEPTVPPCDDTTD